MGLSRLRDAIDFFGIRELSACFREILLQDIDLTFKLLVFV